MNERIYPAAPGGNVYAAETVRDALTNDRHLMQWDADGNFTNEQYRRAGALGDYPSRRLCHNEEGLLQGYWQDDNGETVGAWYAYDAEGRRALKFASERAAGSSQSVVELCDPVYYVSPLVTLTRTGYSKHYFEGGHRICTVIGGGFALVNWDSITSDPMPLVGPHREQLAKVLGSGAESTFEDCIDVQAVLSNTICLYKMMMEESQRYETHEPAFYYHTDHLGSTSRFTDDSGKVVQTLAYMPYGEDWVDDSKFIYSDTNHIGIYQFNVAKVESRASLLAMPRRSNVIAYNGKERDFESGFYYYGARYHWPELWTGWTSPDPLMDKYPGISPYNYCNWNPVIFIDPDGMETDDYFTKNGKYLGSDDAKTHNVRIIKEFDWNSLDKDENGNVGHDLANKMSSSFSYASKNCMSETEQLSVYEHYNPTDYMLENLDDGDEHYGMRSHFDPEKDPTIQIRLQGNSVGVKVCDYADEIINLFVHEKAHIDLYLKLGHAKYQSTSDGLKERDAFNIQINDPSWNNTRDDYKKGFYTYMKRFGL